MKNILLALLFMLPMALFSASPSCFEGMEVSIVDAGGKVIQSGKLNKQGKLTLNEVEVRGWDVKLSNNGESVVLGIMENPLYDPKNTSGDNPLFQNKLSAVKGGKGLLKSYHEAAHVVQQKNGTRGEAGIDETNSAERADANINTSRSNIKQQNRSFGDGHEVNQSFDDATISVKNKGKGKVEIEIICK
jgi:hypothetical protein